MLLSEAIKHFECGAAIKRSAWIGNMQLRKDEDGTLYIQRKTGKHKTKMFYLTLSVHDLIADDWIVG